MFGRSEYGIRWVWIHGNDCRGTYRPVEIDVLIRPNQMTNRPAENLKLMRWIAMALLCALGGTVLILIFTLLGEVP